MSFDVCWNRTRVEWRNHPERAPWCVEAVLTEKVFLGGQPQMKVICRIARIIEDHVDDPPEQERFWHAAARARFGKLHRLDHRDRCRSKLN